MHEGIVLILLEGAFRGRSSYAGFRSGRGGACRGRTYLSIGVLDRGGGGGRGGR